MIRVDHYSPSWVLTILEKLEDGYSGAEAVERAAEGLRGEADETARKATEAEAKVAMWERLTGTITTGAAPPWAAKGSPGAGVNMPRRPKAAQGGFDSRPVADAATSGDRRTICIDNPCPSPRHRARGVSLRATSRCAPTQHRDRAQTHPQETRPDRPPRGPGRTL